MSFWYFSFSCLLTLSVSESYFVDEQQNCNNVYGSVSAGESSEYVTFLGKFSTTSECINACISSSNSSYKCYTYTYHTKYISGDFHELCYGRFNYPLWIPYPQDDINCGQIIWSCESDMDCSLNGKCNTNGNCTCNTGWTGYRCNEIDLLPGNKSAGYDYLFYTNEEMSSWGGSPVYSEYDNSYFMINSEITNHCGMNTWQVNSRVILSEAEDSNNWNSFYNRKSVLEVPFAHEPNLVLGNNNEFVIYYSHYNYNGNNPPCTLCKDGSSPPDCQNNVPDTPLYIGSMIYSNTSIFGPYSDPINILYASTNNVATQDDNLSGVILKNGSFIGISRYWDNNGCSVMYLVTADNWKDNTTYIKQNRYLFPELDGMCTEDPFVYLDCNGYFHALFHNMDPIRYIGIDGGHAYSKDGQNWIYGGYSFGDFVLYSDGSNITLGSRERPHLLFDKNDGCTPIALTNGVVNGWGEYGDASYTFIQPVNT